MDEVTNKLCQDVIRHTQNWINQLIQSNEGDSLQQFQTLKNLPAASVAKNTLPGTTDYRRRGRRGRRTGDREKSQMHTSRHI